jgi:hypothetical protein
MIAHFFERNSVRWIVGVVLPLLMIALDPLVFRSNGLSVGMPIFGHLKPYGHVATGVAILMMAVWLIRPRPSAFASGVFAGGGFFASILGLAIFPFSILGAMFLGMGLLGLTPVRDGGDVFASRQGGLSAGGIADSTSSRVRKWCGAGPGYSGRGAVLGFPGDASVSRRDPTRQALIAAAYQELTGQNAARRSAELAD